MTKQRCLLVVEDSGLGPQLVSPLAQIGWAVKACTSAREAIHLVKHQHVDGLLIAATLPDERGDVVFYRVAAVQPHLRTHTAFLTRTGHDLDVIEATNRVGLSLPVTPDQIVRTVKQFYSPPKAS